MSKVYTAQEMREVSNRLLLEERQTMLITDAADILSRAADAMEREAAKDEEIARLRAALAPILEFRTDTKDWWGPESQREWAYRDICTAQRIYYKEATK